MKRLQAFLSLCFGLVGAGVAAACCLGVTVVLAAVSAAGIEFIIQDKYLFPLFIGFVVFTLIILYVSCRKHNRTLPFWIGSFGAMIGILGLWLLITGIYFSAWLIYFGLLLLVIAAIWDLVNGKSGCK